MTRIIGIFLYDRFQVLELAGPLAAFAFANEASPGAYRVEVLSVSGGVTRCSSGVSVETRRARASDPMDTLILVGGQGTPQAVDCVQSMDFVRDSASRIRRLCSVCSGVFLLAAAGLVDERRVTTHWRLAEGLRKFAPRACVEADRLYVRDGPIWTSGGVSAGIDLALALITEDLGEAIARRVAQDMVVYYRRPGGQAQFSSLARLGGDDDAFSALLTWMRGHLAERLTVEALAERMAMSPRNFSRAFTRSVGVSPAKAVERLRLEVARERVETSRLSVKEIAAQTGFLDAERMRRSFVRAFGAPPQTLRRLWPRDAGSGGRLDA